MRGWRVDGPDRRDGGGEVDQGEVSTIRLGMLESSGFRKYSTLLVIQLFSPRLCLCHCLCICLCLCICVPYSFLNSYYHKRKGRKGGKHNFATDGVVLLQADI